MWQSSEVSHLKLRLSKDKNAKVSDSEICPECSKPVVDGDQGLECENCLYWYHSSCQNTPDARYNEILENHNERWVCKKCQSKEEEDYSTETRWGKYVGHEKIKEKIDNVHKEMSTWQKNHFLLPRGKAGSEFIGELTRLLNHFNMKTHLEKHAISLALPFINLMVQKPSRTSKAKENNRFLTDRLKKWNDQDIDGLLGEAREIQRRLVKAEKNIEESNEKAFCRLMLQGKVAKALKFIDNNSDITGVHEINDNTINKLKEKHPTAQEAHDDILMEVVYETPEPVIYENITAELIQKVMKHIDGSGGPTKLDADFFKHIICSRFYGKNTENLCHAIADLTKRLSTESVDPESLRHFIACRLIPLKKEEVKVRPIGIGEVLRRVTGKCISNVLRNDIQEAAGILQTCCGIPGGVEAAVHSTRLVFEDETTEAVLLVDATNAFNSLNRRAAIHNIRQLCPSIYQYVQNIYQNPADLIINSPKGAESRYLQSEEGFTQGDPIAMQCFGISMRPLSDRLAQATDPQKCRQVLYADDLTGAGVLSELRTWWDCVCKDGPKYGYFPNNTKSILIVKQDVPIEEAERVFGDTGVKITTEGDRHLGAALGTTQFKEQYIQEKVRKWVEDIEQLAKIAQDEPQLAYSAYTRGVCHRWGYVQRTITDISHMFAPLEDAIRRTLLPAIIGRAVSDLEREIMEMPVRYGGLGISNPQKTSELEFKNSVFLTEKYSKQIYEQDQSAKVDINTLKFRKQLIEEAKEKAHDSKYQALLEDPRMSPDLKRLLTLAKEKGAGAWLTAPTIQTLGYVFNKDDFRGSLCIRYGWRIPNMPLHCACGTKNDIDHSLSCKLGGYVIFRHNRIRDITADILKEVCKDVKIEPELIPVASDFHRAISENVQDKARLDVSCVGLWSPLERIFLDIRIFHPGAPSYKKKSMSSLYNRHEREKKRAYNSRVINVEKSTFTPVVFSTHGGMAPECQTLYKHAAKLIAEKRKERYADVMGYISMRLRMALLKSILLSVRGSRGTSRGTAKPISSVAFNLIPGDPQEEL